GAIPVKKPTGPPRQNEHQQNERQKGRPSLRRRIALHLNQVQREIEKQPAQRAIEKQGQNVGRSEIAGTKQAERHHWRRGACLPKKEADHRQRTDYSCDWRRFKQSENDSAQTDGHQQPSWPVDSHIRLRCAAFRNFPQRQNQHHQPEGEIEEEDPSPRAILDEKPTERGSYRSSDRRESRPRADCASSFLLGKMSADQGQTARYQQRSSHALKAPGENQLDNVRREAAPCRRDRKNGDANREDFPASIDVAQRPAREQQSRQQKRIRLNDPLNFGDSGTQVSLYRGQRNIHDGAVDEDHAG